MWEPETENSTDVLFVFQQIRRFIAKSSQSEQASVTAGVIRMCAMLLPARTLSSCKMHSFGLMVLIDQSRSNEGLRKMSRCILIFFPLFLLARATQAGWTRLD